MPWLLNEDAAMKAKLQGLTVDDVNARPFGRPVGVRFRLPEDEIANMTWPSIIIEHGGISKDPERESRGIVKLPYAPEGMPPWADMTNYSESPYLVETPIPMIINYQITVYSRKAVHNQLLTAALSTDPTRLHPRWGFLEIPQDGTIRRMDINGGPEPQVDIDKDGKRVFRTVYSVDVSSEIVPAQIAAFTKAMSVEIDLEYYADTYDLSEAALNRQS